MEQHLNMAYTYIFLTLIILVWKVIEFLLLVGFLVNFIFLSKNSRATAYQNEQTLYTFVLHVYFLINLITKYQKTKEELMMFKLNRKKARYAVRERKVTKIRQLTGV